MPINLPAAFAFLGLPGGMEWVVILVIGLLLFGSRLPGLGRSVGKTITEFKKGMKEATEDIDADLSESPRPAGGNPGYVGGHAPRQLTQEQLVEQATQEALRRLKAEQAAKVGQSGGTPS